jgi:5-methylcytosine-specific restriction endonuclease McrA
MDEARMAKLERLKGMLAHVVPDGDLDQVFDRMLDDALAVEGKKRGFAEPSVARKEAPAKAATPGVRARVPAHVRREVLRRDGYRCTWVHPDGSRCEATGRLEMDHLEPARETGRSGVDDLTTRCRHHNQLRAVLTYGRAHVTSRIEDARRARGAAAARGA